MASTPDDFDDLLDVRPPEGALPPHGYRLLNNVSDAPTIYADGCIFVSQVGDVIRISFVESILEPSNGPDPGLKTKHVANIVMNREGFNNTMLYLNNTALKWAETMARVQAEADAAAD